MWPFSSKKQSEPAVEQPPRPGRDLDITGQDIFVLLEQALSSQHNLRMIPGTGTIGRDRWGDGNYHFRARVEDISPNNIKVYVDEVPMESSVWNHLSTEAKQLYCKNHTVTLKYSENN